MTLSNKRKPWTVNGHGWLYQEDDLKESIKRLKENLIGLFDVYEIKVINEGSEMTLREHEKKRMIISEIDKEFGDALCTNSAEEDGK